jgi:hypothetical protein
MTAIVYFGEMLAASLLAIVLLAISQLRMSSDAVLFAGGVVALTLAEYVVHRFVLHGFAPTEHRLHHANPDGRPSWTPHPAAQEDQLMSEHRILSFKPQLRLEWRGQDGQSETEHPDHFTSLGDSITSSTRIRFSVHTTSARWAITGSDHD